MSRDSSRGRGKGKERSREEEQGEGSPDPSRGLRRSQRGKARALEASKERREEPPSLPGQWQAAMPAPPVRYDQRSFSWTSESSLQSGTYSPVPQDEDLARRDEEILRIMLDNAEPARPLPSPAGPSERLYAGGGIMPLSSPDLPQEDYSVPAEQSRLTARPLSTLASSMDMPWLAERGLGQYTSAAEFPFSMDPLPTMFSSPPGVSPLDFAYRSSAATTAATAASTSHNASSLSSSSSTSLALSRSPPSPGVSFSSYYEAATHRSQSMSDLNRIPACDLCRRRKVKCDRVQPTCGLCSRLGLECTSQDKLKRRGPPTKAERDEMRQQGIFYDRNKRRWRSIADGGTSTLNESMEETSLGGSTSQPEESSKSTPSYASASSKSRPKGPLKSRSS